MSKLDMTPEQFRSRFDGCLRDLKDWEEVTFGYLQICEKVSDKAVLYAKAAFANEIARMAMMDDYEAVAMRLDMSDETLKGTLDSLGLHLNASGHAVPNTEDN